MSDATPRTRSRQLDHADGLPFETLLTEQEVRQAYADHNQTWRNSLYNPAVTLWIFLSQCLDSIQCLRNAVARFIALRAAQNRPIPATDPSGYNKARHRLPEPVLVSLTRQTGANTETETEKHWLWNGRRVRVVDGSTLSMPDTEDNQKHFPQPSTQKPGLGFPLLRILIVFSLAVGTVLEAAIAPYKGKRTGETTLMGQLLPTIAEDDILMGDRYFCTFWLLAGLRQRRADGVFRLHCRRRTDLRYGRWVGREDRIQSWPRPARPEWMSVEEYQSYPTELEVRLFRHHVRQAGFRTRVIMVATTLLNVLDYGKYEIGQLYRRRWDAELHIRSLKSTIQMDILRGQSAAVVRLEVWAHLLAYNLIRRAMARAARVAGKDPLRLSFAGAVQTFMEHLPHLLNAAGSIEFSRLWSAMVVAIGTHDVGKRPDRIEPRAVKRRPKAYSRLMKPRNEARSDLQ